MFASYRRLLAYPGVPYLLIVAVVTRLSTPVLGFALLLAAIDGLGSYAAAGLVLAGHAVALAVCAPLGSRLADRCGPRVVLVGYLSAHAIAYVLLLWALRAHAPMVIGAAVLLGATTPPAGALLRGAWPCLVPAASLPAAYALDNAFNELMFIVGPVLVSALVVLLPADAVVAAAGAAMLAGTALLLGSRAVRHPLAGYSPGQDRRSRWSRWAGPLAHRPTLVLLAVATFGTFSFGCMRIATGASAAAFGSVASAGVLLGLLSAGALAGTLGYGARAWRVPGRRLLALLSVAEAAVVLSAGLAPTFVVLAVLIAVAGLVTGPRDSVQLTLLGETAPARYRTEVFAWLNTFMWTGYGMGTAVAGQLTGPHDNGAAAFGAAAVAAMTGALLTIFAHRLAPPRETLRPPPGPPHSER